MSETDYDLLKLEALLRESSEKKDQDRLKIQMEHGTPTLVFYLNDVGPDFLTNSLQIIKSHFEQVFLQSVQSSYLSVSIPDKTSPSVLAHLKIRFQLQKAKPSIEFSKQGNFSTEFAFLIRDLFQLVLSQTSNDWKQVLESIGVEVYESETAERPIRLEDLYGYEPTKKIIREQILLPLQNPELLKSINSLTKLNPSSSFPRAFLLSGEAGVGKTTMAKAISTESKIPLLYIPFESILSKYYGESSKNLARIFELANALPKSLLFLDEIDSLAGSRDQGMFEATRSLLSVLLRSLDGFSKRNSLLLAATNRPQDLDRALLSRFEITIHFPLPNSDEIAEILKSYAKHLSEAERKELGSLLESESGRGIKDFCESVERSWALELMTQKMSPLPPPFELYLSKGKSLKFSKKTL